MGPDGEQLTLIDDTGTVWDDDEALLALARLSAEARPGAKVAVPVNASWKVNEVLAELGGEVVWTQIGSANLMDVAVSNGATIAASTSGRFGFPEFMPAFDAIRDARPCARHARPARNARPPPFAPDCQKSTSHTSKC